MCDWAHFRFQNSYTHCDVVDYQGEKANYSSVEINGNSKYIISYWITES